ncbi:hypothetical protein EV421DRAFT_1738580 [Armillaria borealis]|uniref:Uncharacterized protein n=1 Tax=Armillaria borealis TaxID=47425 RepID=A0AA39J8S7_9AGAR|nr:hypothetical protein EV421DRAFT_1738580 [Armillaria borealis]
MGGPLFDWLRMMYSRVEYYVKHGGNTTELFSALIGLLTGNTLSPILWNIFFGDLKMPEHKDDVLLISHSAIKTVMMAFGRVPSALPTFIVEGCALEYSVKEKYIGVVFTLNIFRVYEKHLSEKASTAQYYGHCIWDAEDQIGNLHPKDAKQLYMAQDVQVRFVWRMLHLSSRCKAWEDGMNRNVFPSEFF